MSAKVHRVRCPRCQTEHPLPDELLSRAGNRRWPVGLVVAGVVVIGILALAWRYQGQWITLLDLANEATGSTALSLLALGLALFAAACAAGWLLLPFLLAWAYLDLRRRLGPAGVEARSGVAPAVPAAPDSKQRET